MASSSSSSSSSKTPVPALLFPPGRIHRALKEGAYAKRVSRRAARFLAAILQQLTKELLQVALIQAENDGKVRINNRHIALAIAEDEDFASLLSDVIIARGGVRPMIHPELLTRRPKNAEDKEALKTQRALKQRKIANQEQERQIGNRRKVEDIQYRNRLNRERKQRDMAEKNRGKMEEVRKKQGENAPTTDTKHSVPKS